MVTGNHSTKKTTNVFEIVVPNAAASRSNSHFQRMWQGHEPFYERAIISLALQITIANPKGYYPSSSLVPSASPMPSDLQRGAEHLQEELQSSSRAYQRYTRTESSFYYLVVGADFLRHNGYGRGHPQWWDFSVQWVCVVPSRHQTSQLLNYLVRRMVLQT